MTGNNGNRETGLLGGSFNPAHRGHRRITLFAMRALGLAEVWWMVSPGNPLKPAKGMGPLHARVASARAASQRFWTAQTVEYRSMSGAWVRPSPTLPPRVRSQVISRLRGACSMPASLREE